ncbi:DinB family protein [Modestobacter versicolor]|uniref:Putative damage-inducible protein DinB n=1 Tax=Modestobacter versicolor TaxID=429133 RepID=A0A323VEB7_9ACTN|nr:DinB family protein [Modestobacter versicolor]MBB3678278.1 putative damage-inducible protein DinB [Modestobacter versicolor]PZA22403.1 hypothetical protein DMO24_05315 [Modestobacter versicolor]
MTTSTLTSERADLLEALATHRFHLTHTVQDLTDDQARLRPTVSQLSLGGLVKHVAATERGWIDFVLRGASAFPAPDEELWAARELEFTLLPDETLEGVLAVYAEVAARTDELVRTLPSLDVAHPLPEAPWFAPGASWSARRVLVHVVAETAQHAGHADILRETIDGQKSMG